MTNFQRWTPDREVNMELVLTEWSSEADSEWVRAEDAVRREAELLERIRELENRAERSADLLAKAVAMLEKNAPQNAG